MSPLAPGVLGLLGIEIPMERITRPTGESPIEARTFDEHGTQLTGPPVEQDPAPARSRGCDPLAGGDPDLVDEILEAEADALLFRED